jgi:subtilisin family serine protease
LDLDGDLLHTSPHILVRFQPGRAEPPAGRTDALTQEFGFSPAGLRDSLQAAGIVRLERLFTDFRHEDVNSTNLVGEHVVLDDLADIYVAYLGDASDGPRAVAALSRSPSILYAEPDSLVYALLSADALFPVQWTLQNVGQTVCQRTGFPGVDIGAAAAWDSLVPVAPTSIAILDTGIEPTHEDFKDLEGNSRLPVGVTCMPTCIAGGADDHYVSGECVWRHGTAVAGIAAATANNTVGVAGVAFQATPWPVKVVSGSGASMPSYVAAGIEYAREQHFPIVNMSLRIGDSSPLRDACLNAVKDGLLLVAAMGNDDDSIPNYPAAYSKRVCAVGAMFMDGNRWRDENLTGIPGLASAYGSWIDLVAPGGRLVVAP